MGTKCKALRMNFHCHIPFKRPLLDLERAPGRFFSMVYDCLSGKITINTSDFSASAGNTLSEIQWKYRIFGGITSVTMFPDRLAFDFPNLMPSDVPVVGQIIEAVHDVFPKAFSELDYDRADLQYLAHLEPVHGANAEELLSSYEMNSVSTIFGEGQVIQNPAAKFELISKDQRWLCTGSIERSRLQSTAVFVALMISLRKLTPQVPLAEEAALALQLLRSCLAVFGLEEDDAAG
jgi:hypothetical protein